MTDKDTNPRGFKRPHSGIGKGVGIPGGRGEGRNTEPCPDDKAGFGTGEGRGGGRNRRDKR